MSNVPVSVCVLSDDNSEDVERELDAEYVVDGIVKLELTGATEAVELIRDEELAEGSGFHTEHVASKLLLYLKLSDSVPPTTSNLADAT